MNENLLEASMIIPIYNNAYVIRRVVEAFLKQTAAKEKFELIIIDDCSSDHPAEVLADYIADGTVRFIQVSKNSGPALTRNLGLDMARGRIIIFSDGDSVPIPEFVDEHLKFHQQFSDERFAALGSLRWPPEIPCTPLLLLGNVVEHWDCRDLLEDERNSWVGFRTANFSLKRSFLGDLRFDDQTFKVAGFEDTELGFRLAHKGMIVKFLETAISYHYHFRSPKEYRNKVFLYGKSFARWIAISDDSEAKELNERYNYLIDRDRLVSFKNFKELVRRIFINDLTAPLIDLAAQAFGKIDERKSVFLYNKLYKYLFLKGYMATAIFRRW